MTKPPAFQGTYQAPYFSFMPPSMRHHESRRLNKPALASNNTRALGIPVDDPARRKIAPRTCYKAPMQIATPRRGGNERALFNMVTDRGTSMGLGRNVVPWTSRMVPWVSHPAVDERHITPLHPHVLHCAISLKPYKCLP